MMNEMEARALLRVCQQRRAESRKVPRIDELRLEGNIEALQWVLGVGCQLPVGKKHRSVLREDGTCPGCVSDVI